MFYLLGIFSFWAGTRTLLVSTMATYFITKYVKSPAMPWLNFAFVLCHLLINHVHAQLFVDNFNPDIIDITGAQMVLCMKLSSFGWNVFDGHFPDSQLTEFQKDRAVRQHPDILDFLAYVFYFPSVLTGPSYDYMEFQRWIDLSMFDITINDPVKGRRKKRRIPRSGRVAFLKFMQGVGWIVLWVKITAYVSLSYAQSPEFSTENIIYKALYLTILGFTYRLKYYGAWSISEGACILSGLGFNGKTKDGRYKWNRVQNVDPYTFETGQNTHVLLEAWNMNTNKWLKNYVYLRVTSKGRKPGFRSTMATFLTSAIWHGTQPGYYLTFATGAFYQSLGKVFRRNLRPIFMLSDGITPGPYKPYYDIVTYIVTQVGFGYVVQPFVILSFKDSIKMWSSVYFYGHVFIAVTIFIFQGPYKKQVLNHIRSFYPAPLSASEKIKLDSERLRAIKREIEELSSNQPTLGVPQPDMDNFDEDLKEAMQEFDSLKADIASELREVKRRASMTGFRPAPAAADPAPADKLESDKSK